MLLFAGQGTFIYLPCELVWVDNASVALMADGLDGVNIKLNG